MTKTHTNTYKKIKPLLLRRSISKENGSKRENNGGYLTENGVTDNDAVCLVLLDML
ncbi:hypothetical protein WN55_09492 [Dufourea novaeangliae]|uniref:Uncharacterized protein n=1 Tax=Dufourea novaeangliae TaxID=178035 RepID=A0A154NYJ6_DUFNO|nr:hypothetical protein WN55_09492 [Dufourea novaeangliae]